MAERKVKKKTGPKGEDLWGFLPDGYEMLRYADKEFAEHNWAFRMGVAGRVKSPSSFFVIPTDFWQGEKSMMAFFRNAYEKPLMTKERLDRQIRSEKDVYVGMYVALIYDGEWHRGRVLSLRNDAQEEKPFLVRLIDFGEEVNASVRELFRLVKRCAVGNWTYEPAVECQLILPSRNGPQPSPGTIYPHSSWECVQRLTFKRLLFDRELDVTVHRKIKNNYGETVWQVTVNIPEEIGQSVVADKFRYPKGPDLLYGHPPVPFRRAYTPGDIFYALEDALHHCLRVSRPRYQFLYPLITAKRIEKKPDTKEEPKEPDTKEPKEPDTKEPKEPDTKEPKEPDVNKEPKEPDTKNPKEPDTNEWKVVVVVPETPEEFEKLIVKFVKKEKTRKKSTVEKLTELVSII